MVLNPKGSGCTRPQPLCVVSTPGAPEARMLSHCSPGAETFLAILVSGSFSFLVRFGCHPGAQRINAIHRRVNVLRGSLEVHFQPVISGHSFIFAVIWKEVSTSKSFLKTSSMGKREMMRMKQINENNGRNVSPGKFLFHTGIAGVCCLFLGGCAQWRSPQPEMQWILKRQISVCGH